MSSSAGTGESLRSTHRFSESEHRPFGHTFLTTYRLSADVIHRTRVVIQTCVGSNRKLIEALRPRQPNGSDLVSAAPANRLRLPFSMIDVLWRWMFKK
jgi:hypothetical protein